MPRTPTLRNPRASSMSSRGVRTVRAGIASAIAAFVSLTIHIAAGGALPTAAVLGIALVLSMPFAVLLIGRELSTLRLTAVVVAAQAVFHTLFGLGFGPGVAGGPGSGGHPMHGAGGQLSTVQAADLSAAGTGPTVLLSDGMTASHLLAACLTVRRIVTARLQVASAPSLPADGSGPRQVGPAGCPQVSASRGMLKLAAAAATVTLAAALALIPAAAASAHDYLVSSDPVADSSVTSELSVVTLTFSEAVLDFADSTRLQVTGPDGATEHVETACPTVAATVVSAPVMLGAPGKYTVTWRIVSADGHAVSDAFSFRYAPSDAAAAPSVSGTAAGPSCGGSSDPPAKAADPGSDSYLLVGAAVTIAVIAIVTFGIILLRRPRLEHDEE